MAGFSKIQFGDGLTVTDQTGGVIRVDGGAGATGPAGPAGPTGPAGPAGPAAPDATATVKGILQLAGDLAGTAASPQIAAGVIVDADVAVANKDGLAAVPSLRTLGTGAQQAAAGNDARLTNARTPTAHATTHQPGGSDAMAVDAVAATGSLRTLGTGAQQAAAGNDVRFTDARAPTAHHTTHEPGGSDPMAVDAVAATGSLRTLGTGAQQATAGNDSRLSNARTPTAHAASHQPGGSDPMAVDAAAATGSLRTLGSGAAQAAPGNDARFPPCDTVAVAAARVIANKLLAGDAQPAFRFLGDGKHEWGPGGATAPDTNLYRSAVATLSSDGDLDVRHSSAERIFLGLRATGQAGILLGSALDTSLYRSAANTLQTGGQFESLGDIRAGLDMRSRTGLGSQITLSQDGSSRAIIYFGSAFDVSLYRSAAGVLATDGGLKLGNAASLYSGSGAPATGMGAIGDFYFRTDTPTVGLQRVYQKTGASTWLGVV